MEEGWKETAAAPLYGSGQKDCTSACCVLGIATHFPAQRIIFQARLVYGIGLFLVLYVIHQRDLLIKYFRAMDTKHFFLTESKCGGLVFFLV